MTRSHLRTDGSLALQLDFRSCRPAAAPRAVKSLRLHGRDKYKVLDHRRRQAQITARRLLRLMEGD